MHFRVIFSSFLAKQQAHFNFDESLAESADSKRKTREEMGPDWPIIHALKILILTENFFQAALNTF